MPVEANILWFSMRLSDHKLIFRDLIYLVIVCFHYKLIIQPIASLCPFLVPLCMALL